LLIQVFDPDPLNNQNMEIAALIRVDKIAHRRTTLINESDE